MKCSVAAGLGMILAFFGHLPWAQASPSAADQELGSLVRVLDRPLTVYSYQPRRVVRLPDQGPVDRHDSALLSYLRSAAQTGFPATDTKDGVYCAVDPVISQSYGSDHWALMQIVLPQGTVYLDNAAGDREDFRFSPAAQAELQALGCAARTLDGLKMRVPGCRAFMKAFYLNHGIQGYAYDWDSMSFDFCAHRPEVAFVISDPSVFDEGNTAVYVKDLPSQPDGGEADRSRIEALFERRTQVAGSEAHYVNPWPGLAPAPDGEIRAWAAVSLYGCNAP